MTNKDVILGEGRAKLLLGDCLERLREIPDESVDAAVMDPPGAISFMGKEWDHHKGGRAEWVAWLASIMRECLRVLKPGGHALVWAIPRTSHWTGTAIEDAGFEVRDVVSHIFSTGFPKSLDVGKSIDKSAGAERALGPKRVSADGTVAHDRSGARHEGYERPWRDDPLAVKRNTRVSYPATDAARQWDGWGTALKPAVEFWWLARKPLIGTVVHNVMTHGTGALNINECRIETKEECARTPSPNSNSSTYAQDGYTKAMLRGGRGSDIGRWPAHLVHDGSDEVLAGFPDTDSGGGPEIGTPRTKKNAYGEPTANESVPYGRTTGSASRYFYCAKASQEDREAGNNHPTVKSLELMRWLCRLITPPGGIVLDPFTGSGSTGKACIWEGFRFIGIERDPGYFDIAVRRITRALAEDPFALFGVPAPAPERVPDPLLFAEAMK